MKHSIATNREQSDRLLKCGVPAESADMVYNEVTGLEVNAGDAIPSEYFPAWSLSALLELLPKRIERGVWSNYTLSLSCDGCFWDLAYSYARYCGEDDDLVLFEDADPIKVCVKAIEWLTANGYKLNGIEKGGSEHGED